MGLQSELTGVTAGFTNATLDDPLVVFDSRIDPLLYLKNQMKIMRSILTKCIFTDSRTRDDDDVFSNVKDFVLDSLNRKIYAIDGSRIWALEIAQ